MSIPVEDKLPLECSIEQIVGATKKQLLELTDEEWLLRLDPILKQQEAIFATLPKQRAGAASIPNSKLGKGMKPEPPKMRAGRDIAGMIKAGMSPEQATISFLTDAGVKFTPEMILEMKKGKKS